MKINKFKFQFKSDPKGEWEDLTDSEFCERLYKYHNKVTPLIKDMLNSGRIHVYPDGDYRICLAE